MLSHKDSDAMDEVRNKQLIYWIKSGFFNFLMNIPSMDRWHLSQNHIATHIVFQHPV